jgi:hypothetical protein
MHGAEVMRNRRFPKTYNISAIFRNTVAIKNCTIYNKIEYPTGEKA